MINIRTYLIFIIITIYCIVGVAHPFIAHVDEMLHGHIERYLDTLFSDNEVVDTEEPFCVVFLLLKQFTKQLETSHVSIGWCDTADEIDTLDLIQPEILTYFCTGSRSPPIL
jgi:hypothetical protein